MIPNQYLALFMSVYIVSNKRNMISRLPIALLLFSFCCFSFISEKTFNIEFYEQLKNRYTTERLDIFYKWEALIKAEQQSEILSKLNLVNQFSNRNISFKSDIKHWKKQDYWATPIESLGTGAGDCEDFAIFKYMTLLALGIDESKLRLMYVRALTINEPHMVLIYSDTPSSMPLVLDNLNTRILPANKRRDLKPIYSFNGQGLWLAKAQGLGNKVKSGAGSKDWTALMERIEQGQ